jgi:hypothetical protein
VKFVATKKVRQQFFSPYSCVAVVDLRSEIRDAQKLFSNGDFAKLNNYVYQTFNFV